MYDSCNQMKDMAYYFPDEYSKGRKCAHRYFFTVLATLHPEYVDDLLLKCKKDRFGADQDQQNKEAIMKSSEWASQLKKFPQIARKS